MRPEDSEPARPATWSEPIIHLEEVEAEGTTRSGAVRSLSSTDPAERAGALADLVRWGLTARDVEAVSELLLDPVVRLRRQAAEALAGRADDVDLARLEAALDDPADEVRATAVSLAASRRAPELASLFPLVATRRWRLAQERVLDVLPGLVHRAGLSEVELTSLLQSVARLPSPPRASERERLAELARAVGRDRLVQALSFSDSRRLGAVRLLAAEGRLASLRAIAGLGSDPLDDVRIEASMARERLEEAARHPSAGARPPEKLDLVAIERGTDSEAVGFLVGALLDPDREVRDRAWGALTLVDWDAVLGWVREALRIGSDEDAALAAHVAERLMLSQVAVAIMERGARVPQEGRGPFESALTSFGLEPPALAAAVLETDERWRAAAVRIAWMAGGRAVVPHLARFLEDPAGPVRRATLEVMDDAGDPAARRIALESLVTDPSSAVRLAAVKVLATAPWDFRATALERAVRDPDPDVRVSAARILPHELPDEGFLRLLPALEDGDERVWREAVRHLAALDRDPSAVWQGLALSPESRRGPMIEALAETGAERLEQLALLGLRSPSAKTRALAVELAAIGATPACLQGTIDALDDPDASVRRAAARGLAELGHAASVPALSEVLSDPDRSVRLEAVRALAGIDDHTAIPSLATAALDPEPDVREAAVRALGSMRMGGASADLVIDRVLELGSEAAPRGGWLLQRIVGFESFLERLGSLEPAERLRAVVSLATIGGPRAVDALIGSLGDPDRSVRLGVLRALGELGDRRARDAVERTAHSDPVPEVAAAAREILRELPEPGDMPE
ncbi:MAG: HEAT repeat domain-containing protein [Actinomycetota bacterium]